MSSCRVLHINNKGKLHVVLSDEVILVTGATGYIASWVIAKALLSGARVRGTVRDPNNKKKLEHLTSLPEQATVWSSFTSTF